MSLTPEGLQLIRQWEGCRLAAYPDPASGSDPWTIGYGHTGAEVRRGLQISQAQAEAWLEADVAIAEAAVERSLQGVALSRRQRDALVSFCFNVGAGSLEASTLRRRLVAGEAVGRVIAEELPRWCKGPTGPVEGLLRRRAAELAHASEPSSSAATTQLIRLEVPFFSQNDSATGQGSRMCFSSSCAMAVSFLRPGCLQPPAGRQADDHYLQLLQRHGDTTDPTAQLATLAELDLSARFHRDGSIEQLIGQLQRGIPCPVGWLHRGPVSAPTGGGHWSLVIGWDPSTRQLLMHDPNGEADLVNGGYVSTAASSGRGLRYSERNWGRRWLVEGPGSGWWVELLPAA